MNTHTEYEGERQGWGAHEVRRDAVTLTNGTKRLTLGIAPGRSITQGTSTTLTPETARALAADLIERAEWIDEEARRVEEYPEGTIVDVFFSGSRLARSPIRKQDGGWWSLPEGRVVGYRDRDVRRWVQSPLELTTILFEPETGR